MKRSKLYYILLEEVSKFRVGCRIREEENKNPLVIPDKSDLFEKLAKKIEDKVTKIVIKDIKNVMEQREERIRLEAKIEILEKAVHESWIDIDFNKEVVKELIETKTKLEENE